MIRIMEASAGSGKTYNLAKTYIRLLLQSDDLTKYRHILAVTFTNKATDEMKRRILKELHTIATDPCKSPYYEDFVEKKVIVSPAETQKKAQDVLGRILHDYGAFAVSTIDRFFQQTLKAFSREIGHFASYQVELDKASLVDESVDRVLDNLSASDKGLLKWLTDGAMAALRQEGRFNVKNVVADVARSLKSDRFRQALEKDDKSFEELFDREHLESIRKVCREEVVRFEDVVRTDAARVLEILKSHALTENNFKGSTLKAIAGFVTAGRGKVIEPPTPAFLRDAKDSGAWFKNKKENKAYVALVEAELLPVFLDFCALFEGPSYKVYRTAYLVQGQIDGLAVVWELQEQFTALLKEKNVLSLDDSNTLLRDIIDGSDAPFVYEKIGVRFENYLLDEFQDTSTVQWENFRPLLSNSHSCDFENLVVGDVKQSIYRFRDSDWHLLSEQLPKEFGDAVPDPLRGNHRTLKEIVEFNNRFFLDAAEVFGLTDLFTGVKQFVRVEDPAPGSVDIVFKDKKEAEMDEIVATVRQLKEHGALYKDIAILVRGNKDGSNIAERLIREQIPVMSDDSLRVKSSRIVRLAASGLALADVPPVVDASGKTVVRPEAFEAWEAGIEIPPAYDSLPSLAEQILRSAIASVGSVEGEVSYIQSFMDYVMDWTSLNGNDLAGFVKDWKERSLMVNSPSSGDSVRIITIHKSKGLEFPYVILPFVEKMEYFKNDTGKGSESGPSEGYWCHPDVAGTPLEGRLDGLFRVRFSEGVSNTYFADALSREKKLQIVDNLNLFYVAMTRPRFGLKVIALGNAPTEKGEANMAQRLKEYLGRKFGPDFDGVSYSCGELYDFAHMKREEEGEKVDLAYPSWPLGDVGSGDSRLRVSMDAADFFAEDGTVGVKASQRLRGIVYHGILSRVRVPSDLDAAVQAVVGNGEIEAADGAPVRKFLQEKIASVQAYGWFPSSPESILNEVEILDADGTLHRPDRVVVDGSRAIVVDYKFGEEKKAYLAQVSRYMRLLEALGYACVSGFVWYVEQGSDGVRPVG